MRDTLIEGAREREQEYQNSVVNREGRTKRRREREEYSGEGKDDEREKREREDGGKRTRNQVHGEGGKRSF